jgi:hypothetical protein
MKKDNFIKAKSGLSPTTTGKVSGFVRGTEIFDIVGAFAKTGLVINPGENEK